MNLTDICETLPHQWHPRSGTLSVVPTQNEIPNTFFWYPLGYCYPLRHPAARVFLATEPCRRTLLLALRAGVCLSLRLPTCGCCGSGSKIRSQWTYTMSRINQTAHFSRNLEPTSANHHMFFPGHCDWTCLVEKYAPLSDFSLIFSGKFLGFGKGFLVETRF